MSSKKHSRVGRPSKFPPEFRRDALVGFGLSGATFQRLARNPLASPDIIGVDAGAAMAAVFVIVILHGSSAPALAMAAPPNTR